MAIWPIAYRFFRTGLIVSFRAELRSRRGDLDHRPLDAGDRIVPRCAHGQRDCPARRRQAITGSRRHPQFGRDALAQALAARGIDYAHDESLGGRRRPRADSRNTAWRNDSFRGYADYMETPEFARAIEVLLREARMRRVAIMCAEMLWWQCHRGLIADYLKAREHVVTHIAAGGKTEPHPFTSAARIIDGRLSYHGLLDA